MERRQYPRVAVHSHAWVCEFKSEDKADDLEDCVIRDISEGGMQITCECDYYPGKLIMITEQDYLTIGLHPVVGVVTWCKDNGGNEHSYGIKFLHLSDHVLARIKEIVNDLMTQQNV